MRTIIILLALLPYSLLAESLFKEVEIREDSWEVVFHSEGIRYKIEVDGSDRGISEYLQRLQLKKSEQLKLIERHHTYLIQCAEEEEGLEITMTYRDMKSGELKTSKIFEPEHGVESVDFQNERLEESRKGNRRNESLDYYLSEKEIGLPDGDYLLIAYQPNGNVSSCMIIDLGVRHVRILPGTHEKKDEKIIALESSEYDYLSELNSSDLMKNFPSESGKVGFDGHSLVIYSRSAETERYISHWEPEYMGMDIFRAIHEHFKSRSNKLESPALQRSTLLKE